MPTSTVYADETKQAWSTYTSTSGRTSEYINLLQSHYDAFLAAATEFDTVANILKGSDTPTSTELVTASNACDIMSTSLTSIGEVIETFPAMDKATINKAATLDQAALTKVYDTRQAQDRNFAISLNNILYACQILYAVARYPKLEPDLLHA